MKLWQFERGEPIHFPRNSDKELRLARDLFMNLYDDLISHKKDVFTHKVAVGAETLESEDQYLNGIAAAIAFVYDYIQQLEVKDTE